MGMKEIFVILVCVAVGMFIGRKTSFLSGIIKS